MLTLEDFLHLQQFPLTICFEIIWLAMIIMLILFARNPTKRKWLILFVYEFVATVCAVGICLYNNKFGSIGTFLDVFIPLGAALLYIVTLLVTAIVSQWVSD